MDQKEITDKYLKPEFFEKEGDLSFLNAVLTGELSAIKIYDKLIDKFEEESEVGRIKEFRMEHVATVNELQSLLETKGEHDIQKDSGLWGSVASSILSATSLIGSKGALYTVKTAEEMVLKAYKEALDREISDDLKKYVKDILIPRQERHVNSLTAMLKMH